MPLTLIDLGREVEFIPADASKVPYRFSVKLVDRTYTFALRYNEAGRFFTADLFAPSGEVLALGDPVRVGRPLFGSIEDERFPIPAIVPCCLDGQRVDAVTLENFGREVRLALLQRRP